MRHRERKTERYAHMQGIGGYCVLRCHLPCYLPCDLPCYSRCYLSVDSLSSVICHLRSEMRITGADPSTMSPSKQREDGQGERAQKHRLGDLVQVACKRLVEGFLYAPPSRPFVQEWRLFRNISLSVYGSFPFLASLSLSVSLYVSFPSRDPRAVSRSGSSPSVLSLSLSVSVSLSHHLPRARSLSLSLKQNKTDGKQCKQQASSAKSGARFPPPTAMTQHAKATRTRGHPLPRQSRSKAPM